MIKNTRDADNHSNTSIGGGHPGCMYSVLHVLKYHHWHFIKKRLPHKKGTGVHHASGHGNRRGPIIALDGDETSPDSVRSNREPPQLYNFRINKLTVHDTNKHPSRASKGSVKSRIKSLFGDELSKGKGRHHRSSTYPVRSHLTRMDSMHHRDISSKVHLADLNINDENSTSSEKGTSLLLSSVDTSTSNSSEDLSDNESETTPSSCQLGKDDKTGDRIIMNGSLQEISENKRGSLIHRNGCNTDTPSSHPSEVIMDDLDMINRQKEFSPKRLQDSNSHLASQFHNQQVSSTKKGYSKSVSFPSGCSSLGRGYEPGKLQQNQVDVESHGIEEKLQSRQYPRSLSMSSVSAMHKAGGVLKLKNAMAEFFPTLTPGSVHHPMKPDQNQAVMKHSNDLKQKIRHVIEERKEEKNRITMDAILHKVPQGHRYPEDTASNSKDSSSDYDSHSSPSPGKRKATSLSRALSLSRSLDRYCQLYNSSFKKEAKPHMSKTLKLTADDAVSPPVNASKSMSRILSLPDLKSYICCDSPEFLSSGPVRGIEERPISETDDFTEQMSPDYHVSSEQQPQLDTKYSGKSDFPEYFNGEKYSITDDKVIRESVPELEEPSPLHVSSHELPANTSSFESFSSHGDSETIHVLPNCLDVMEHQLADSGMITPPPVENEVIDEKTEVLQGNFDKEGLLFQVNAKDKAEFVYVRDILDLSGFSGNELLGAWHSNDQPLDPLAFEEMEGCMLLDPECSGNTEGGNGYYQLLFDLLNEVLLEIYSRSYSYYPLPLCYISRIRPMPVGHHVLEEVWSSISWHLRSSVGDPDRLLDYVASRDLGKTDWWMNLQFDAECAGMELEDIIFSDLLDELVYS